MNKPFACLILLLAAGAASAADSAPLNVCLVSGSEEYKSDDTLAAFRDHLEANYPAKCTLLKARGFDDLPGLEALDDCDVALFFTRRLTIGGEQLARIKKYVEAGRPIVAVRTASHGFQNWLDFDRDVLGGNYRGHYRNDLTMRATVAPGAEGHPVLDGVKMIASLGSLYRTSPLARDAKPLLIGSSPEGDRAGGLGPGDQGSADRLHVAGCAGRLRERDLPAPARQRPLLGGPARRRPQSSPRARGPPAARGDDPA